MSKTNIQTGNFTSLLQVLFIALKLTGHIDWSWFYVMMPTIIPFVIIALILAFAVIVEVFK